MARVLALTLLLAVLFVLFRFAMGLRYAKRERGRPRRHRARERGSAMKSHTLHLTMNVPARMDFVNITHEVEKAVARSGIREGLCLVNAMHITASVFINDDEPGLHEDYKRWLEQ